MRSKFIKRKGENNLLPFQQRLLAWLKHHESWIIANTDKNLGPCAIELSQYIMDALTHLNNESVYESLTAAEATAEANRLYYEIHHWTVIGRKKRAITDDEVKYIRHHTSKNAENPHGYFYLLYKVHKEKLSTRPVCSDCASITNPIGRWVDTMLQPIAKTMPTYFPDSFAFKKLLDRIVVPPGGLSFTNDAKSMFTNIETNAALSVICPYLRTMEKEFGHYNATILIQALEIVMKNNIIRFGDIYRKQIKGTAMGKPPAPPWATLFEGLHEIEYLVTWRPYLQLFKRFIDDSYGIWLPPAELTPEQSAEKWLEFKAEVNNNHGLEWEFSELSDTAQFLDLTTKIQVDGRIKTSLYEKPMALYLFIPPHSAHPNGVLTGHICGNVLRIFRLNSDECDIIEDSVNFYNRFLSRGHKRDTIKPLFLKAIDNARKFIATSDGQRAAIKLQKLEMARRRLYLHIEHHPQNPPSNEIQQLFTELVLRPPGETPLNEMDNGDGWKIPIDAMIIASHRAPNLGDMLTYRDISSRPGPPVSSFF